MNISDRTRANILFLERLTEPVRLKKHRTWRQKFDHYLECEKVKLQTAIMCHPAPDAINDAAVVAHRDAIDFARQVLGTNGKTYREVAAAIENRIKAADEGDHIAFIARLELYLFRLRHLDG